MDELSGLFQAMVSGPHDRIGRDECDGLIVSTVLTIDMGYETAIVDRFHANPVERYESREAAEAGHAKWCKLAPDLATITKLGYGELVQPKEVTLTRFAAHVDSEADSL